MKLRDEAAKDDFSFLAGVAAGHSLLQMLQKWDLMQ